VETSLAAIKETARRGIQVGGHLIVGLPGESREDYLKSVEVVSNWPLNNIKFHQLQLIKGTAMAREYENSRSDFMEFTMESYLQLMMEMLEKLNPAFVVERIAGEVNPGMALKEGWGIRYDAVLRAFEEMLEKHDSWQGKYFNLK